MRTFPWVVCVLVSLLWVSTDLAAVTDVAGHSRVELSILLAGAVVVLACGAGVVTARPPRKRFFIAGVLLSQAIVLTLTARWFHAGIVLLTFIPALLGELLIQHRPNAFTEEPPS